MTRFEINIRKIHQNVLSTIRNPFIYGLYNFKCVSVALHAVYWYFVLIWGLQNGGFGTLITRNYGINVFKGYLTVLSTPTNPYIDHYLNKT